MATAEQLRQELQDGLDAEGLKYQVLSESDNVLALGFLPECFEGGITDIDIFVDFDEIDPCTSVHFKCERFIRIPEEKRAAAFLMMNEMNKSYRWVKCWMGDDGYINVDGDEHVSSGVVVADCIATIISMAGICQEIYKKLMGTVCSS